MSGGGSACNEVEQLRPEDVLADAVSFACELLLVSSETDDGRLLIRGPPLSDRCRTSSGDSTPTLPSPVLTSAMLLPAPSDMFFSSQLAGDDSNGIQRMEPGDIFLSCKLPGDDADEVPSREQEPTADVVADDEACSGEAAVGRSAQTPEPQAKSAKLNSLSGFSLTAAMRDLHWFSSPLK